MSGYLIIISGPSGVGKGTIIKETLKKVSNIGLAVSATTRDPRVNEEEGKDYYFLTKSDFENKIQEDAFLEWCVVHNNKYGTLKKEVEQYVENGFDVILEIDIKGAEKVKNNKYNTVSIFISPPTFQDLIDRLKSRNTEKKEVIEKRLSIAEKELAETAAYDYVVINSDINEAVKDIISIIKDLRSEIII
ncbi:MAG: guanylate kinase [bacterium]|nr:guanylate kinase [bacterium]